jgi:hypothetical protein
MDICVSTCVAGLVSGPSEQFKSSAILPLVCWSFGACTRRLRDYHQQIHDVSYRGSLTTVREEFHNKENKKILQREYETGSSLRDVNNGMEIQILIPLKIRAS